MKVWLGYTGVALVVAVVGALCTFALAPGLGVAVTFSAVLAWALQAVAFAVLLRVRDAPNRFMIAWLGGIVLRFGVVGLVAYWVTRGGPFAPAPTLLSLVAFVFVMLMLEPLFLRKGRRTG